VTTHLLVHGGYGNDFSLTPGEGREARLMIFRPVPIEPDDELHIPGTDGLLHRYIVVTVRRPLDPGDQYFVRALSVMWERVTARWQEPYWRCGRCGVMLLGGFDELCTCGTVPVKPGK